MQNEERANVGVFLDSLCEEYRAHNRIDPECYERYNVKRGLRNADGTGVMAGVTQIGNVLGYYVQDGERVPAPGKLIYRGIDVEELVDELYELVEKAWNLPLSRGRAMLDVEEVRTILDEIRETMPQEIRQAKAIVADRSQIISDAKREAETIIRVAEERANTLVNQNEIVKQAQQKANEMLAQAQTRFREMRKASNEYIEDLMKRADEGLSANLAELRKTRQNIKASLRSGQN